MNPDGCSLGLISRVCPLGVAPSIVQLLRDLKKKVDAESMRGADAALGRRAPGAGPGRARRRQAPVRVPSAAARRGQSDLRLLPEVVPLLTYMYLYCLFFLATCCTIAFRLLGEHDQVLPDVCIAQFIMPFPIPASFMCSSSALVPLMTFCIAVGEHHRTIVRVTQCARISGIAHAAALVRSMLSSLRRR